MEVTLEILIEPLHTAPRANMEMPNAIQSGFANDEINDSSRCRIDNVSVIANIVKHPRAKNPTKR